MRKMTPFVGQNGKLLNAFLGACNWSREQCYLTNLICHSVHAPEIQDFIPCAARFRQEMKAVKPKLIITVGDLTCQILTGKPLSKARGVPIWNREYNCYVMGCYQPVAIYNDPNVINDLVRDLKKIPDILQYKPFGAQGNIKYEIVYDAIRAQQILRSFKANQLVTIDIECNPKEDNPDIYANNLLCLSVCADGENAYVFPADICKGLEWPMHVRWGYQMGQYDIQGIQRNLGVILPLCEDSLAGSYALDERTPRALQAGNPTRKGIHGLKQQAREFEGAGFYEDEVADSWRTGNFDFDKLYEYNARDAVYTYRRIAKQKLLMQADGVYDLYNNMLIPLADVFTRMQYRGIAFDPMAAHDILSEFANRAEDIIEEIQEEAQDLGFDGFVNISSPQQLSKLLFNIIGLEPTKLTKSGKPSTDAEVLEELDHPIVDKILTARTLEHMKSAYLMGPIGDIKSDLCVHPSWMIHGTVTGRPACKAPPMATLPKSGRNMEEYSVVRRLFVARPGYVFAEFDYSQIEMWLAAWQCQDPNMLSDLKLGNYHGRTAARILNKPVEDITLAERTSQGKKVNFGILYQIGAATLAKRRTGMNCSVQTAQRALNAWHENYTHYKPWTQEQIKTIRRTGELQTVTGRKRRVPLIIDDRQIRQIVNYPTQSTASDYTLTSLIELEHMLTQYVSYPIATGYDSITFELNEHYLQTTLPLIKETMERVRFEGWPSIKVEATIGPNLLDMEKIAI